MLNSQQELCFRLFNTFALSFVHLHNSALHLCNGCLTVDKSAAPDAMKTLTASPSAAASKTTFIGFRCPADLAETLKQQADTQQRSLSNFILFQLASVRSTQPRRARNVR
jgi:hypothetical protein